MSQNSIKLHIGESIEISDFEIKLLSFESITGGKEYEECGDLYNSVFELKKENKTEIIKISWVDLTSDSEKSFHFLNYKVVLVTNSSDVFQKKDEKGAWISIICIRL